MRIALALVLLVGCRVAPATSTFRLAQGSRIESTCEVQACGGGGEALPATLIGLAILLGVTVVHETMRGS
jgi:hypothetical protein